MQTFGEYIKELEERGIELDHGYIFLMGSPHLTDVERLYLNYMALYNHKKGIKRGKVRLGELTAIIEDSQRTEFIGNCFGKRFDAEIVKTSGKRNLKFAISFIISPQSQRMYQRN